jgi:hypothetical protein
MTKNGPPDKHEHFGDANSEEVYDQEVREGKWIMIVMKIMKEATLHLVIDKKLKYRMLMECGIEDGCYRLIFKQEMDCNVLHACMIITKQQR